MVVKKEESAEAELHLEPNPECLKRNEVLSAPDGGWGWMVVLGCTFMHFLIGGFNRSYGVLYVQLRHRFHSSAAITAWVSGMSTGLRMGLSPLATALSNRFGTRATTFVGGIIFAFGAALSAFAPSTEFLFLSYSLFTGLGGTLVYSPPIVLVNKYFDKRRSIATGIATAGSGMGAFAFPPVVSLLFIYYGYFGALLITSAVTFNLCVCASFYRPIDLACQNKPDTTYSRSEQEIVKTESFASGTFQQCESKKQTLNSQSSNNCDKCLKSKYIDLSLLCDPVFLIFGTAQGLLTMSYVGAHLLLVALAESRGITENYGVFLLSAVGIADTTGRISSGFIFDCYSVRKHRVLVYNICIFLTALTYFGWAFSRTFVVLVTICILHGYINGIVVSQRAVMASDILGAERLSSSFGLTVCLMGCGNLVGPFIAGYLRDAKGSYAASYIFCGISTGVASVIFFCGRFFGFKNKK